LRLFAVCEFHASGLEGGDDLLAVSTGPSTTELLAKLCVTVSIH
jgi:hypothetical protein